MNGQKKTPKKLLSLVLVAMMIVSTMVVMPLTASAVTITGDGSQETPYEAANYEELVAIRDEIAARKVAKGGTATETVDLVDGAEVYVNLTGDIYIEQVSATDVSQDKAFELTYEGYVSSGTTDYLKWQLNGNGHTIYGLQAMLFRSIAGGSTIENLNIADSVINEIHGNAAVFVGYAANGTALTFRNVVIEDTVTFTNTATNNHAGAFVGGCDAPGLVIENCKNYADMALTNANVGGFVGTVNTSGETSITNSVNAGNVVTTANTKSVYVGGLVGYLKKATNFTIENCVNEGNIETKATYVGGLIGIAASTGTRTITNCRNDGDVTAVTAVGGAIGFIQKIVTAENFVNTGDITATGADNTTSTHPPVSAGGFVGAMKDGTQSGGPETAVDQITLTNAINEGTIEATNSGNAAAFVGHAKRAGVWLNNCYDNGLVKRNLFGTSSNSVGATYTASLEDVYAMIDGPRTGAASLAATAWDGTTVTAPASGEGTEESPYLIGTAAELAWFSAHNTTFDLAGADTYHAKLTADINLGAQLWNGMLTRYTTTVEETTTDETTGEPTTTTTTVTVTLNIYLDGDNYTIYNTTLDGYTRGFFVGATKDSYVLGNVTLSNLHFAQIKAIKRSAGSSTTGVVAGGLNNASATITLTNVTTGSSCTLVSESGNSSLGGMIGTHDQGTIIIDKCINAATVYTSGTNQAYPAAAINTASRMGGFVGYANANATSLKITNSINEGAMNRYVDGACRTGAIVGLVLVSKFEFTNVFSSSALANAADMCYGPNYTNCYTPSEVANPANATAIKTIKKMGVTATVGAYEGVRLKLTDDFGFMPMYAITGGDAEAYNPFVSYGIKVGSEFVSGELYNGSTASFCVPYTGISVAKMSTDVTYTPVIMVNGVEVATGEAKTINCYTIADALRAEKGNGYYEGNLVTEDTYEIALYGAMADYCKAYSDYYANLPEEYK